jgi:hypothetical protein
MKMSIRTSVTGFHAYSPSGRVDKKQHGKPNNMDNASLTND